MKKLLVVLTLLWLLSCGQNPKSTTVSTDETSTSALDSNVVSTAKEAYIFSVPLVLMDITRRHSADPANPRGAPLNTFNNLSVVPDANFRSVVRPNADTYYSSACLDLQKEPLVLTVPDTKGRYYMMPMMDAYTNVFVSPGERTTGTRAGNFLITGPKWTGDVPTGMKQIKSPTDMVWIIGRTQVNSKQDGDKVVLPIQKGYKLTPLSAFGKTYSPSPLVADSSIPKGDPNSVVRNMSIEEFFNYANKLMVENPPTSDDKAAIERFASIGVGPGKTFDASKLSANTQAALKNIPGDFAATAKDFFSSSKQKTNGWGIENKLGSYGTDYQKRAFVAYGGLGANLPEDAIYPAASEDADGNKLNGANNYVLHFEKGATPPANAFWSLTMYDPEGYMVENPINRNAIGDRSNLKQNADGSTDIYIQHASPGKDKESNWLPAPSGDFNLLMRVYWPKEEMINGKWIPQAIKKI